MNPGIPSTWPSCSAISAPSALPRASKRRLSATAARRCPPLTLFLRGWKTTACLTCFPLRAVSRWYSAYWLRRGTASAMRSSQPAWKKPFRGKAGSGVRAASRSACGRCASSCAALTAERISAIRRFVRQPGRGMPCRKRSITRCWPGCSARNATLTEMGAFRVMTRERFGSMPGSSPLSLRRTMSACMGTCAG